jgi:hypothetical protein
VKCWGDNAFGQLGNGEEATDHGTAVTTCGIAGCPVACFTTPCETELNASILALGSDHGCAITVASAVRCWGRNSSGQVGDGTLEQRDAPVDVEGPKQSNTPTASATRTATPTRTRTPTPTRTATPAGVRGDANCDGRVDSIDAAVMLQYGAGLVGSLACALAADVNHDGRVDSIDAALVLQYVAGLLHSL